MRIAVLDDKEIWRFNIESALMTCGHDVFPFELSAHLLDADFHTFHAIICDRLLIGEAVDGSDILAQLRNLNYCGDLYLYTSHAFDSDRLASESCNFTIVSKDNSIADFFANRNEPTAA